MKMLSRIIKSHKRIEIIINKIIKCTIVGKTSQPSCDHQHLPRPYPYSTKNYTLWNALFDDTFKRMRENSKIITIDGPLFAGKTKLAIELAKEFNMCYMAAADLDMLYINDYGYDMRNLDPFLPKSCRSLSWKDFWKQPKNLDTAALQIITYKLKYEQYVNALIHLLNTGQGVIVDNSVFSDFAYMEAMHKNGFVSDGVVNYRGKPLKMIVMSLAKSVYGEFIRTSIDKLLKPHLILYLNISVDEIQKRITRCGQDYQKSSPLLKSNYFNNVNRMLKNEYLTEMGKHSELLIYDWSNYGDKEIVVEDIERVNFDKYKNKQTYNPYDIKLGDWRELRTNWDWNFARITYTKHKDILVNMNIARFDVPELTIPAEDARIKIDLWMNAPGMKYQTGFNPDLGDNVLFKW